MCPKISNEYSDESVLGFVRFCTSLFPNSPNPRFMVDQPRWAWLLLPANLNRLLHKLTHLHNNHRGETAYASLFWFHNIFRRVSHAVLQINTCRYWNAFRLILLSLTSSFNIKFTVLCAKAWRGLIFRCFGHRAMLEHRFKIPLNIVLSHYFWIRLANVWISSIGGPARLLNVPR